MGGNEIRKKYIDFFVAHGHANIPSASLIPENDPTTLFTGSGMQPLVPYLSGQEHPKGLRLVNSQKCFRAEDIEEVGDNRHTTFFEMLGNWSLGDYFKKEQLSWFYSFLIDEVKLDPERIYVTVFSGDEKNSVPKDAESVEIWEELFKERKISYKVAEIGSEEDGGKKGMKNGERIFYYDASKNWWSRAGVPENMPVGEIGGPDSEVFYEFIDVQHDKKFGKHCHPNCDCGRFLEIGNSVFMEYIKTEKGFEKLPQQNVDFGGGLERITAAHNNDADIFKIDLLHSIIEQIEKLSGKKYEDNLGEFRVIADHVRGAVFMIGDGVFPSNTDRGYFVRRLLRRSIRYANVLGIPDGGIKNLTESIINTYKGHYPNLSESQEKIEWEIDEEEKGFIVTLKYGMKKFEKMALNRVISGDDAFTLFSTHGFPIELTEELASERGIKLDRNAFNEKMIEHQEKSRAGAGQKFKGGLADSSEKVLQYHTATHLLLAGLRHELGENVHQAGSNITGERLRFDFTNPEKVDRETLNKIEMYVNNAIHTNANVTKETIDKERARGDVTIEGSFWERYPGEVDVYTIAGRDGTIYSRELCGGPHVENIKNLGTFKIIKEESVAAGVRRIKAILE